MSSPAPPYRAPEVEAPAERPRALDVPWSDAENTMNPMKVWMCFALGVMALLALGNVVFPLGVAFCAMFWGYGLWYARTMRRADVVRFEMVGDEVGVSREGGAPEYFALSSIRDVEMETKDIRRVSYEQQVGAPLPTTNVSAEVGVKRMVIVLDGPARRALVTTSYSSASHCTEQFGKVRVFLRRNGWLPLDERAAQ